MRPKTGEVVWYYQFTPNDAYDYDACWELILADLNVQGRPRQSGDAAQPQRLPLRARSHQWDSDFRESVRKSELGEPGRSENRATGRDRDCEEHPRGQGPEHWPSTRGARTGSTPRFNPQTGLLYANTLHEGRMYKHQEIKRMSSASATLHRETWPLPRAAGEPVGHIEAIDPLTARRSGACRSRISRSGSAMLATGGGVLFTGKETGRIHRPRRRHRQTAVAVPDRLRINACR